MQWYLVFILAAIYNSAGTSIPMDSLKACKTAAAALVSTNDRFLVNGLAWCVSSDGKVVRIKK